jgi:hypothetical protein
MAGSKFVDGDAALPRCDDAPDIRVCQHDDQAGSEHREEPSDPGGGRDACAQSCLWVKIPIARVMAEVEDSRRLQPSEPWLAAGASLF